MRGRLSPFGEALALASLTSICAYAVNDGVMKLFFGVPNPATVLLEGAQHSIHLLAGDQNASFPSGHMVLAASFGGAFMKLVPASTWPLSALLFVGALVLIVGDWHFVSDVIAGGFVGLSAGVLAGDLWSAIPIMSYSAEFRLVAACCIWPPSPRRDDAIAAAASAGIAWAKVLEIAQRQRVEGLVADGLRRSRGAATTSIKSALESRASRHCASQSAPSRRIRSPATALRGSRHRTDLHQGHGPGASCLWQYRHKALLGHRYPGGTRRHPGGLGAASGRRLYSREPRRNPRPRAIPGMVLRRQ